VFLRLYVNKPTRDRCIDKRTDGRTDGRTGKTHNATNGDDKTPKNGHTLTHRQTQTDRQRDLAA